MALGLSVIPGTMLDAFPKGDVLPELLLSLLFGFSLNAHPRACRPVLALIDGVAQIIFRVLATIMQLAPLGALGAMAFTVGRSGVGSVGSLAMLKASFYVTCAAFVALALAPLARLHGFASRPLLSYRREELLIVLATSSTEPVRHVRSSNSRRSRQTRHRGARAAVRLLLQSGRYRDLLDARDVVHRASVRRTLSASQIAVMLGIGLLTSKGVAGVSCSGLVALVATLSVMPEPPVAGVAMLVGIDRFMSGARALTSVISHACAVIFVLV